MRSFTLIETLVAIFVFSLIMGAVSGFVVMAYRTYGYTWQQSTAIEEARRGIETMVKEIREARTGDDGSYPIEKADDKEFIFYSDIDKDGEVERVRYFLGTVSSGNQIQECVTFTDDGTCSVTFSDFLKGALKSAQLKVSVDGDFGSSNEYSEIFADGTKLGDICKTGCSDCPGSWQGTIIFDVTSQANDNFVQFSADATSKVNPLCPHSMKVKFEFSWTEEISGAAHELKKGVTNPVGEPIKYPLDQEKISIISAYVRNAPPIFEYYNGDWPEDTINNPLPTPVRLQETKLMRVYLIINFDPNRPPQDFGLESSVQLRNLEAK